jgi:hypothetical protein
LIAIKPNDRICPHCSRDRAADGNRRPAPTAWRGRVRSVEARRICPSSTSEAERGEHRRAHHRVEIDEARRHVYEIKVLQPDGRAREIKIDARTGVIVGSD